MKPHRRLALVAPVLVPCLVLALAVSLAPACKDGAEVRNGILRLLMSDAPFLYKEITEVRVKVSKIEVHRESTANSGFVTLFNDPANPRSFNLLDLVGGVSTELVNASLPEGTYKQIRLYVAEGDSFLKLDTGSGIKTYSTADDTLRFPSGSQSGIKLFFDKQPIVVTGGLTTELLLDFDLSRSFHPVPSNAKADAIELFNVQPVIRTSNVSTTGTIKGKVLTDSQTPSDTADDTPLADVTVTVYAAGNTTDPVATTPTDASGNYAVAGLAPGSYDLVFEEAAHASGAANGVSVTAGNATTVPDLTLAKP